MWVLDTTFLWGVSSVGLLEMVLGYAAGRLRVTEVVYGEMVRRAPTRPFLKTVIKAVDAGRIEKVIPTRPEQQLALALHSSLWLRSPKSAKDLGEAETIAVAGSRGWHAVIDEKKARLVLPMRFPASDCYCTPQVMLALAEANQITLELAYDKLQAMTRAPNFQHEFAGKSKAKWMQARSFYGPVRF